MLGDPFRHVARSQTSSPSRISIETEGDVTVRDVLPAYRRLAAHPLGVPTQRDNQSRSSEGSLSAWLAGTRRPGSLASPITSQTIQSRAGERGPGSLTRGPFTPVRRGHRAVRKRATVTVVWDTEHVGDEPPVHIETEVTMDEDVVAAGQGAPGLVASESRVVREPGRWSRLIAVVVVVGVVAGGLLWWAGAGWPGDDGGEEPRSGSARDGRPTRVAFYEAVNRLAQFGAFAYSGDVHAVGQSAFRPGDRIALDVSVEGAVLLNAWPHPRGSGRFHGPGGGDRDVRSHRLDPQRSDGRRARRRALGGPRLHGSSSLGTAAVALLVVVGEGSPGGAARR